jgi:hypothetical protein
VKLHGSLLSKLERFSANASAQIEHGNLETWLTSKLEMTENIPEKVRTRLVQMTKGLKRQALDDMNFEYENGNGILYKTCFILQTEQRHVNVALVVFGASFDMQGEPASVKASGKVKVGEDGILRDKDGNPIQAGGVSAEHLKRFMDYLEFLAHEQIWERALPSPVKDVEPTATGQLVKNNGTSTELLKLFIWRHKLKTGMGLVIFASIFQMKTGFFRVLGTQR